MLWKKSGAKWSNDELMPIKSIKPFHDAKGFQVKFKNGDVKELIF
jgi:hypothetical protein